MAHKKGGCINKKTGKLKKGCKYGKGGRAVRVK